MCMHQNNFNPERSASCNKFLINTISSFLQSFSRLSYSILSPKETSNASNLIPFEIEIFCDYVSNYFIVNSTNILHDITQFNETIGETGGSTTNVSYKDSLRLLLANNINNLIIKVFNVPCTEFNPHDGFLLLHF